MNAPAPQIPKAKQLLDVSLFVWFDKCVVIPLVGAKKGKRFKWALYPVQSEMHKTVNPTVDYCDPAFKKAIRDPFY